MELERSNQYIYKIPFRKNRDAAHVSNTSTQESEAVGFPWVPATLYSEFQASLEKIKNKTNKQNTNPQPGLQREKIKNKKN